jgi:glutamyl-tRNA reductase
MERIALAGLSLHDSDLAGLERAKRHLVSREEEITRELADGLAASDLVLISTCNRVEVAYAREEGHPPAPSDLAMLAEVLGIEEEGLRSRLHFHGGRSAARHLFRVVASLDSLVLGEDQILVQVREAFARAEAARLCGGMLHSLFQSALELGKQVRSQTDLALHPVSVVSIATQLLAARFPQGGARAAILGAGVTGELVARNLAGLGCAPTLCVNRSLEGARRMAAQFGGRACTLEQLRAQPPVLDALFAATSSPEALLGAQDLSRMAANLPEGARLLAVDLSVPRNLAPCDDLRVEQIDLESLRESAERNRALRARAALEAEALIEDKLDTFARRLAGRVLSQTLAEMQAETSDILEREIAQLHTQRLGSLPPEQRVAVERWARATFGRLAHVPVSALKRFASDTHATQETQERAE